MQVKTKLKRELYLSMIHNLGPMSNAEIWEHLWGAYSPLYNNSETERILGFGPEDPYYVTRALHIEGFIYPIGKDQSSIIWRAK
jgi:hypothetical protein